MSAYDCADTHPVPSSKSELTPARLVAEGSVGAVLFDLDDTIVVERRAAEEAVIATCRMLQFEFGVDPVAMAEDVFICAGERWRALPTIDYARRVGVSSWEGLWATFEGDGSGLAALRQHRDTYRREVWSAALARHVSDPPEIGDKLAECFRVERLARMWTFDYALSVVRTLADAMPVAIVTNGAPDTQHTKARLTGLADLECAMVVSGEVGVGKPDPKPILHATEILGVNASQTLFVGDSMSRDIEPSLALGMWSVLIDHLGKAVPIDTPRGFVVHSMSELTP